MNARMFRCAAPALALLMSTALQAGEFPDEYFFGAADRSPALKALEGKPAPKIELAEWIGDETSLEELRGNVVIVDFWATWCGPCMAAIPKNVALIEKFGDQGLRLIGIHDANGGWDKAAGVVTDKKINYPVAKDADGKSVKAYGLSFWPTYVVIDRQGVVRAAGLTPDKVEPVVKVLLAQAGGPASTKGSEFPADWYVGGDHRPAAMRSLEGKKAPELLLPAEPEWIGDRPADHTNRITVVHFISPAARGAKESLSKWSAQAKSLGPHGVQFIGVCDHLCDWQAMQDLAEEAHSPIPIVRDRAPDEDQLPMGRTAAAYGVRLWPTTVIIDRAGRVRAAGINETHLEEVVNTLMVEPINAKPEGSPTS